MARPVSTSLVAIVVVVLAVPAAGQQRVWTETGEPVAGWEFVDDGIEDYMQTWAVPGAALAIAADGRLLYSRGFTWDTADAEIVKPDALFRIASMSKPITSVAIHQLIEDGLYTDRALHNRGPPRLAHRSPRGLFVQAAMAFVWLWPG